MDFGRGELRLALLRFSATIRDPIRASYVNRIALIAAIGAGLVALPSCAAAQYFGYHATPVSDSSRDPDCDGNDDASVSKNSGGCFWIKSAPPPVNSALQNPVTAGFYCDTRESADPERSSRDGCTLP